MSTADATVHHCSIEVRGYELDGFGHVNHAQYISYMEHARWKMLEKAGIGFTEFKAMNRFPVIARLEASYKRSTYVDEILDIQSRIVEASRASFTVNQKILRKGELVFEGQVIVALVDDKGRPSRIPEEVARLWS